MYRVFFVVLLLIVSQTASLAVNAEEKSNKTIMVSLHPLALLVKSAWPEVNVVALMSPNQSPHDFSLKPSDIQRISDADGIVWSGKDFEPYLSDIVQGKSHLDLSTTLDFHHHDEHFHDHHDEESATVHDPHFWLNPLAIEPILNAIADRFQLSHGAQFRNQYQQWLAKARNTLADKADVGFVSFHDAFVDWNEYFELKQLEKVTINPEQPVGTRHILEVRKILASGEAACLFVEPQFKVRLVERLTQGLEVKQVNIDPIASEFQVKNANFLQYYDQLLDRFITCFNHN
ncbi:zinc ABC transporter solute-binding protein [Bermanella marisrubri]|uniref:High-affinity zinc uptake system protein ZnuA n=1 Tax=Bermanella marisrubri TaxID=207949 RepID=Q1MZ76_9GAMM|nr:zinc ABC transporter substrate-binding protein [Bermanella marisrubri]EAT11257.1 zinc ABC transporter, periplasmic zinc-binding protein [Oceanobacter sp. RED65] [Bermanella marisrubri]QIZ82740.1 zinc ABC transporter solute-binding protein [Bermanella marisrubri]